MKTHYLAGNCQKYWTELKLNINFCTLAPCLGKQKKEAQLLNKFY